MADFLTDDLEDKRVTEICIQDCDTGERDMLGYADPSRMFQYYSSAPRHGGRASTARRILRTKRRSRQSRKRRSDEIKD